MSGSRRMHGNSTVPSQLQIFYQIGRNNADLDIQFLEFVKDGLTREELEINIQRRPEVWGRWKGFLDKLPTKKDQP